MKKILLVFALLGFWATSCQSLNTSQKTRALAHYIQPVLLTVGLATLESSGYFFYQSPFFQHQLTATILMVLSAMLASWVPTNQAPCKIPCRHPNFYVPSLTVYTYVHNAH